MTLKFYLLPELIMRLISRLIMILLSLIFMAPSWDDSKTYTFIGEIVDSKCALGAMSPGKTKAHKTCAIKCIKNGIPPLLRVKLENNHYRYYLLTAEGKNPANSLVLPFVGDIVEVVGTVIKDSNMVMIEIQSIKKILLVR